MSTSVTTAVPASDSPAPPRRPAVVTVALVVLYLGALASVALGVMVLLSRYRVASSVVLGTTLLGAGIALAGLLMLAVASAVGRADGRARIAVTVWVGILAVLQAVTIIASDDFDLVSAIPLALDAVVIVALWLPVSTRWFRGG